MRPMSEIEMFNGLFGLESVWTILSHVWGTSQKLSGTTHVWRFLNSPVLLVYSALLRRMTSEILPHCCNSSEFQRKCGSNGGFVWKIQ